MKKNWGVLFLIAAVAPASSADAADLFARVPADAYVMIAGQPSRLQSATTQPVAGSGPSFGLEQLVSLASQLKMLPEQARVVADVVTSLSLLGRYPYVFALLDISSKPLPGGAYRLEQLQAAMMFEPGGDDSMIASRIRQLLTTYTNDQLTRLDKSPLEGAVRYRLVDSRLPEWTVMEWALLGNEFIVSIGDGAFDRMLSVRRDPRRSMANDAWFQSAHRQAHGDIAFLEWSVAVHRLRDRLGEVIKGRPEEVIQAIGAETTEQILGTIGREGRAISSWIVIRNQQEDVSAKITGPIDPTDPAAAAIPPAARGYACFALPMAEWITRGREAYLASQGTESREVLYEGWAKFEEKHHFSFDKDFLAHMGRGFIIHDYPPHPLRIPLLWTFLIETDGEETAIRRAVDGMMQAWQDGLPKQSESPNKPAASTMLRRTQDGIWYFQLGLAGPAIGVKGRWIVISFSPAAVRENMVYCGTESDDRSTGTAPVDSTRGGG